MFSNHPKFQDPSSEGDDDDSDDGPVPFGPEGSDDSAASEISTDSEPEEAAAEKPYSVLLQSLVSARKDTDADGDQRKTKRRKIEHGETKDGVEWVDEHGDAEEDGEDGDDDDGMEAPGVEEEDSDGEDASDSFEAHFANPSSEFLGHIMAASKGEWQNLKLAHPEVGVGVSFSAPARSQVQLGRKVGGLKDVKLKRRLEAPFAKVNGEFTPLQKALVPYVFAHQDVLFCSRTLGNAEELRRITCLHALNHIFKYTRRCLIFIHIYVDN